MGVSSGVGAVGMIAPFLWMFTTSLRDASHAYDLPPQWLPTEWDWSNYAGAGRRRFRLRGSG